jgi:hypothetical protein
MKHRVERNGLIIEAAFSLYLGFYLNIIHMFLDFRLVEIGFLAIVCAAFGTIDSNGFAAYQISIFQEGNKQFE